ncbi:MAG: hypothetical protein KBD63_02230 [Bacteriovoracaceae bacterium]|nr:hypothetical protein [Bacteriovoracaceae bacterium]
METKMLMDVLEGNKDFLNQKVSSCNQQETDSGLCDDLYAYTCADGVFDDGTGVTSTEDIIPEKVEGIGEDVRKILYKKFLTVLKKSESQSFLQQAIKALGYENAPDCEKEKISRTCLQNISQSLSRLMIADIIPDAELQVLRSERIQGILSMAKKAKIESPFESIMQNNLYNELREFSMNEFNNKFRNYRQEKKLQEKIFPRIKDILIEKIKFYVDDESVAQKLVDKIKAISLKGFDCSDSKIKDTAGYQQQNANYDPQSNVFSYCEGFLVASTSEFKMAKVIAHELAHAIDPCYIVTENESTQQAFQYSSLNRKKASYEYPFLGVIPCLELSDSIGSKFPERENFDEDRAKTDPNYIPMAGGDYSYHEAQRRQSPFCVGNPDQIGESFADWLAMEVVPEYITRNHPKLKENQIKNGYSNIFRGSCNYLEDINPITKAEREDKEKNDEHPSTKDRVNKIILANPQVRLQMGCSASSPKVRYCNPGKKLLEEMKSKQNNNQEKRLQEEVKPKQIFLDQK